MDQVIKNISDETVEIVKDFGRTAKKQITVKPQIQTMDTSGGTQDKKPDDGKGKSPVTGKPIPSKKMVTQLSQQVAQLSQMRMKKVREELEKQRLKVKPVEQEKQVDQEKEKEDVVAKVLKASKSTGEFGKNIGG